MGGSLTRKARNPSAIGHFVVAAVDGPPRPSCLRPFPMFAFVFVGGSGIRSKGHKLGP